MKLGPDLIVSKCVVVSSETSKSNSELLESNSNILVGNYYFLESYITSEGAVSHNVLYYQELSIDR